MLLLAPPCLPLLWLHLLDSLNYTTFAASLGSIFSGYIFCKTLPLLLPTFTYDAPQAPFKLALMFFISWLCGIALSGAWLLCLLWLLPLLFCTSCLTVFFFCFFGFHLLAPGSLDLHLLAPGFLVLHLLALYLQLLAPSSLILHLFATGSLVLPLLPPGSLVLLLLAPISLLPPCTVYHGQYH